MSLYSKSCVAVAAATLSILASPAAAEPEVVSVTVSYADLDLKKDRDVDVLNLRLSRAIDTVCGRRSHQYLALNRLTRPCRRSLQKRTSEIVSQLRGGRVQIAKTIVIRAEG